MNLMFLSTKEAVEKVSYEHLAYEGYIGQYDLYILAIIPQNPQNGPSKLFSTSINVTVWNA